MLTTEITVASRIDPAQVNDLFEHAMGVLAKMRDFRQPPAWELATYPGYPNMRHMEHLWPTVRQYRTVIGQGLPAQLQVLFDKNGQPLVIDPADEEESGRGYPDPHWVRLVLDSSHGLPNPEHPALIESAGAWLNDRGHTWRWRLVGRTDWTAGATGLKVFR